MNDEKSLLNQMIYNSEELIAQYKETVILNILIVLKCINSRL